ncbi:MAG: SUMF1/EgtB/PvdO family nonheme iron enzyme [Deltaproteobacteria bacterium]|nr:SUMF1/EgtB/PvdO family nonheme iron enzyme [Deltaproteobacteria bacterium]
MSAGASAQPHSRRRVRLLGAVLGAALLVLVVGVLGLRHAGAPQRCPEGLVALGPRCCAPGQYLQSTGAEGGRSKQYTRAALCRGRPERCPAGMRASPDGCVPVRRRVLVRGGQLRLGAADWEAPLPVEARAVEVASFRLDSHEVTEEGYAACVAAGRCPPLPLAGEPGRPVVGATAAEAEGYCRFVGGRLPRAYEIAFAAMGPGARRYPWGDTGAVCRRAAFGLADGPCAQGGIGPDLAGARPDGASPEGVHDLAGNVAEWVRSGGPSGPAARDGEGVEVRGGSWRARSAAALRGWYARPAAPGARADDVGWRCAYDEGPP